MGKPVTRIQAAALGILAALLLAVAWLTDRPAGPVMALAGGILGWLVSRLAPAATTATLPPLPAAPAPASTPAPALAPVYDAAQEREAWSRQLSALRHDLRGILSPAMLIADRLLAHPDPAVQRAGDVINRTVERATARLTEKPSE